MNYVRRYDGHIVRIRTLVDDGVDEIADIPPYPGNADYEAFLEWEAEQPAPLTPEAEPSPTEAERAVDAGNGATLRAQAAAALADNRAFIALSPPTNAQVVAQTKALSRQMNGLIRLLLGELDGTD